jgi:predicted regulator of Ras-like GTPase activity (Roadblock/LC7/MglB family)
MSKAEQLAAVLDEFLSVSLDVEAAAVVSSDGLPMASALPPDVKEDRLAAMSAALLSLGERAAEGLDKGELAQVYVEGSAGNVVLMAAGRHAVRVAMTAKHAKAGLVLYEMRSSARRVEQVLEEPASIGRDYGRHEAVVSRHSVDPTPAPPPEESPFTAISEAEPPTPAWEDQAVQATPDWEAQPGAEPASSTEWAEQAQGDGDEGSEPWGEEHGGQDQGGHAHEATGPQGEQQPDEGYQVSEQSHGSTEQWSQQQSEDAQREDRPKQWDDEQRDENSSFKSW